MSQPGIPIQLREARPDDCELLWQWANDPGARAVSFSAAPIPWDGHVDWFRSKLSAPDCQLYVAEIHTGVPAGQVRFDMDGEVATISISLSSDHRGKGLGWRVIRMSAFRVMSDRKVRTIYAYVRPDNVASLRSFEKAGFLEDAKVRVGACDAIRLRLLQTSAWTSGGSDES